MRLITPQDQVASAKGGYVLLNTLVFASIAIILLVGLVSWFSVTYLGAKHLQFREQAFQIAEAGVDYYRWHLAHWPTDYYDGMASTTVGPYVHEVEDKDGNVIGRYSLMIGAPTTGSTIVTVTSTGVVDAYPSIERTVRTQLAIPSFAKYAIAANDEMRFGEGTEVFGPVHSNGGIRFDGLAHNQVTSALSTYDDPDHSGNNEHAVHTHVGTTDPLPPTAMPSRPDVFESGRQVNVPAIDFTGITTTLSDLRTKAQTDGRYYAPSGYSGYHVVFQTDDKFKLYRVTSLKSPPQSSCTNVNSQTGWGTWTINAQTLLGTYDNPPNGVIFIDDHVWVSGQIDTARITLAAGRFPVSASTYRSITVNSDLTYTNYDGSDVLALISQNNINVGLESEDDLRIDAALIAQNGRVGRYYYEDDCTPYHSRSTITLYGMLASAVRYGFAYTDGSGYQDRIINYDARLLYAPPPHFPLAADQYETISWEEIE